MFLDSILLAIAAWVFVHILMGEGMIMGWWAKIIYKLPEKFSEPLGGCEYCVAGQMALWYYLYKNWNEYGVTFCDQLIGHILFITLTIFIVKVINIWKQSD